MTAGGYVCHRAELGHWLIPVLNLRRSHMTFLGEPAYQGGRRGGREAMNAHAYVRIKLSIYCP